MKKVSAATITQLTAATAGNDPLSVARAATPPSAEELIAVVRAADAERAEVLDRAMARLPEGFALVPTFYTRISHAKNAQLESEYLFSVRQRFLKFLATSQATALRDLGICDHGIARMARGLDPATEDGRRYNLSVDHIIERFGSGALSDARQPDPKRPAEDAATYPVNHFGNLILLPQDIHDLKNELNAAQGIHQLKEGEGRWILMLTPVTTARRHGYVATPQPVRAELGQLKRYQPKTQQQMGDVSAMAGETGEVLQALRATDVMGNVIPMLETLAARQRPALPTKDVRGAREAMRRDEDLRLRRPFSVADLAVSQPRDAEGRVSDVPPAHRTLRGIFNAAIAHDRTARHAVDRDVRPRLDEVRQALKALHARVEAKEITRPGHTAYREFVTFFRGRNLRRLCIEAGRYPVPEARALLEEYRRIDRAVTAREKNARGPAPARKAV